MSVPEIESLFETAEPAELGPGTRPGVWPVSEVKARGSAVCAAARVKGGSADCLQALALLWHDHCDEAHGLVQDLSGADAAWVHGIVHRREPDYSNARYWFHRVGAHSALERLADVAAPVLAGHAALPFRLIRDGKWDLFAFIDAVSAAARQGTSAPEAPLLRELQRLETLVLAGFLASST